MEQRKDFNQAIRVGITGTFLNQTLKLLISVVSLPILARCLTPSDFGYFSIMFAIYLVLDLLRDLGISAYQLGEKDLSHSERTGFFWVSAVSGAVFFIISFVLFELLSFVLEIPYNLNEIIVLNFGLVINGISSQFLLDLRFKLRYKRIVLVEILATSTSVLVAISIALGNGGIWALILQQLTLSLVSAVLFIKISNFRPSSPIRIQIDIRNIKHGLWMSASQVTDLLSKSLVTLQLGREVSLTELGLFDRAQQLQNIPNNSLNIPIRNMSLPILRNYVHEKMVFENILVKWQFVVLNISLFCYSILFINASTIITGIYGENYLSSIPLFKVLLLVGMVQSASHVAIWTILLSKISVSSFRLSLANLFLISVFVQFGLMFGLLQALISLLVANFCKLLLILRTSHKISGINMSKIQKHSISLLIFYFTFSIIISYAGSFSANYLSDINTISVKILLMVLSTIVLLSLTHVFHSSGRNDLWALILLFKRHLKNNYL